MTITDYVFDLLGTAFGFAFGCFLRLLTSSGAASLYIAIFAMYCIVRFLIAPIIGDAVASYRHDRRVDMSNQRKQRSANRNKGD